MEVHTHARNHENLIVHDLNSKLIPDVSNVPDSTAENYIYFILEPLLDMEVPSAKLQSVCWWHWTGWYKWGRNDHRGYIFYFEIPGEVKDHTRPLCIHKEGCGYLSLTSEFRGMRLFRLAGWDLPQLLISWHFVIKISMQETKQIFVSGCYFVCICYSLLCKHMAFPSWKVDFLTIKYWLLGEP